MGVMRRLNTCSSNICDASYMEFLVLCYWQVQEPIAPPAVDWLRIRSVEAALVNLRGAATRLDWTGRRGRCTSIRIEGVPVGSTSSLLLVFRTKRVWWRRDYVVVLDALVGLSVYRAAVPRALYMRRN